MFCNISVTLLFLCHALLFGIFFFPVRNLPQKAIYNIWKKKRGKNNFSRVYTIFDFFGKIFIFQHIVLKNYFSLHIVSSAEIRERFLFDRLKHDARFRLHFALARLKLAEYSLEIDHGVRVDFQNKRARAGDCVAFDDFGVIFNEFSDPRARRDVIFVAHVDLDIRRNVQTDRSGVEDERILLDNARRFKLFYSVGDRRDGHADLLAYRRRAEPGILFQTRKYLYIFFVKFFSGKLQFDLSLLK